MNEQGQETDPSAVPSGQRRSAADRLLGSRIRISPWAWMFVLCVLYNKDKRQNQDKAVQTKYRKRTKEKWPSGQRWGSAAARFLEKRVRIPRGHGCLYLASVVCCQVEVSATGRSLIQESYRLLCVAVCSLEILKDWGGSCPIWAVAPEWGGGREKSVEVKMGRETKGISESQWKQQREETVKTPAQRPFRVIAVPEFLIVSLIWT
jgi:hypothetical protein